MKTFIKTIGTTISVLLIVIGLTALFTIDNAQGITGLIAYAAVMIISISGGIYLLTLMYPELTDLSEFEENHRVLNDYEQELTDLREHNLLLLDRYIIFKSIIKASKVIDDKNMENYPNIYHLIYEEDLTRGGVITVNEGSLEQIDKVK